MQLRKRCSGVWIAALVAVLDRVTKVLAEAMPAAIDLLPGVLRLRSTFNKGIAFSMLSGSGVWLIAGPFLLIAALTAWLTVRADGMPKWLRIGLWMIVGGGIGNLYDRIMFGYVIDFIEPTFVRFAVFNIADAGICIGAFIAAAAILIDERRKETAHE